MKARKRFYWLGVIMFNNHHHWPSYHINKELPDWAVSEMQKAYLDRGWHG